MIKDLTEKEKLELESFLKRSQELKERRLISNGLPKVSIQIDVGKTIGYTTNFPDEEDFRSTLIAVRTFVLNDEPNNFYHICNVLYQKIKNDELRGQLTQIRGDFKSVLEEPFVHIIYGDQHFIPQDILNLWLNAYYFHTDETKEKLFKQIVEFDYYFVKYSLFVTVFGLIRCILALRTIIETLMTPNMSNP